MQSRSCFPAQIICSTSRTRAAWRRPWLPSLRAIRSRRPETHTIGTSPIATNSWTRAVTMATDRTVVPRSLSSIDCRLLEDHECVTRLSDAPHSGKAEVDETQQVLANARKGRKCPFTRPNRPRWALPSCGPFVVIQQTAQPGTPTDSALGLNTSSTLDQPIPQPLMVPLTMIVSREIRDGSSKVALANRNDPIEALRTVPQHDRTSLAQTAAVTFLGSYSQSSLADFTESQWMTQGRSASWQVIPRNTARRLRWRSGKSPPSEVSFA
jgi:hypothetical protein